MKEQIWKNKESGEKFVVAITEDGEVWNADGPLTESGIKDIIIRKMTWVGDGTMVDNMKKNPEEWEVIEA